MLTSSGLSSYELLCSYEHTTIFTKLICTFDQFFFKFSNYTHVNNLINFTLWSLVNNAYDTNSYKLAAYFNL